VQTSLYKLVFGVELGLKSISQHGIKPIV